ncbi:MAG: UvrD-helicase domain-containing protein [Acidobacteria bacterium]|nr:UvrD-helicase domain-containing protein [Acidobacteriota bacterium]
MSDQMSLFDSDEDPPQVSAVGPKGPLPTLEDAPARAFATNPANNVVLEASAGTGKTTVLVSRYVNLLRAGVDPSHILAITFTRQAAAEMRDRIIRELRVSAERSQDDQRRWRELRDRLGEIAISTIDAFCLSLLREFPLEADLDPAFGMADETEVPRLVQLALDRTLARCGALAAEDVNVAMVLAQLGAARVRTGLAHLLQRRLVAPAAMHRFLAAGPRDLTAEVACRRAAVDVAGVLERVNGGLVRFLADGPVEHPRFAILAREVRQLRAMADGGTEPLRCTLDRVREYFLTADGKPRKRLTEFRADHCRSPEAWRCHTTAVRALAPDVSASLARFDRDMNVVLARGAQRIFAIAVAEYERELAARSVLDFSDVLQRALDLLRRMDEFAQSRYRLESRYHHVLVDEFQDTSRAQWELVSLLVQSWGEGFGLVHDAPVPPSVFVVGDRKQSIYGFRDADVGVLRDAGAYIETLRPDGDARRSISHSFRAVAPLLAFLNDLFGCMEKADRERDGFRYEPSDRFPVTPETTPPAGDSSLSPLGLVLGDTVDDTAERVAQEIARLLAVGTIRDRDTGVARRATPGDVAILFRSRDTHREFQAALEARAIPAFVYKGLGFFDADEIKDYRALLRFLADPTSELRTAALLRSRLVRVTDAALAVLAGRLSSAVLAEDPPPQFDTLDPADRALLSRLRASARGWVAAVDRIPPAELIDRVYAECAYAFELRGPRLVQARENLKKMRGLVRRVQNRGFATLARIADHVDRLSGDVSNAVVDAFDAVNLMTVHAAKGLEFPVVFLVEMARGTRAAAPPIRVVADDGRGEPCVSVAPFRSAADEDRTARDREETKRLLYVATTRARDRLYLSATRTAGVVRIGAGSFATVLPPSLVRDLFGPALPRELVRWAASADADTPTASHTFFAVGPVGAAATLAEARDDDDREPEAWLEPWQPAAGYRRVTVTALAVDGGAPVHDTGVAGSGAMVGRLVHRMLQRAGETGGVTDADLESHVVHVMNSEERARPDVQELTVESAAVFRRAMKRADVAEILRAHCVFEVPFSMRLDHLHPHSDFAAHDTGEPIVIRGTIDCLQRRPDGGLRVIELKTGGQRPHHERQLALYVDAVRAMFPEAVVDGTLVYL